jgi:hypothetical protein
MVVVVEILDLEIENILTSVMFGNVNDKFLELIMWN